MARHQRSHGPLIRTLMSKAWRCRLLDMPLCARAVPRLGEVQGRVRAHTDARLCLEPGF